MTIDFERKEQSVSLGTKMESAFRAAAQSPNRVRKVGALLVLRDGTEIAACNTFPPGVRRSGVGSGLRTIADHSAGRRGRYPHRQRVAAFAVTVHSISRCPCGRSESRWLASPMPPQSFPLRGGGRGLKPRPTAAQARTNADGLRTSPELTVTPSHKGSSSRKGSCTKRLFDLSHLNLVKWSHSMQCKTTSVESVDVFSIPNCIPIS